MDWVKLVAAYEMAESKRQAALTDEQRESENDAKGTNALAIFGIFTVFLAFFFPVAQMALIFLFNRRWIWLGALAAITGAFALYLGVNGVTSPWDYLCIMFLIGHTVGGFYLLGFSFEWLKNLKKKTLRYFGYGILLLVTIKFAALPAITLFADFSIKFLMSLGLESFAANFDLLVIYFTIWINEIIMLIDSFVPFWMHTGQLPDFFTSMLPKIYNIDAAVINYVNFLTRATSQFAYISSWFVSTFIVVRLFIAMCKRDI